MDLPDDDESPYEEACFRAMNNTLAALRTNASEEDYAMLFELQPLWKRLFERRLAAVAAQRQQQQQQARTAEAAEASADAATSARKSMKPEDGVAADTYEHPDDTATRTAQRYVPAPAIKWLDTVPRTPAFDVFLTNCSISRRRSEYPDGFRAEHIPEYADALATADPANVAIRASAAELRKAMRAAHGLTEHSRTQRKRDRDARADTALAAAAAGDDADESAAITAACAAAPRGWIDVALDDTCDDEDTPGGAAAPPLPPLALPRAAEGARVLRVHGRVRRTEASRWAHTGVPQRETLHIRDAVVRLPDGSEEAVKALSVTLAPGSSR